jgi:hypothetical protein
MSNVDLGAEIILPTVTLARNGATPSKTFSNRQKESVNVRNNGHFDNRKAPVPSVSSSSATWSLLLFGTLSSLLMTALRGFVDQ